MLSSSKHMLIFSIMKKRIPTQPEIHNTRRIPRAPDRKKFLVEEPTIRKTISGTPGIIRGLLENSEIILL